MLPERVGQLLSKVLKSGHAVTKFANQLIFPLESSYEYKVELETIDGKTFIVHVLPYGEFLSIALCSENFSSRWTDFGHYGNDWKLKVIERTTDATKYELTFTNNRPKQICFAPAEATRKLEQDIELYEDQEK